LELFLFFLDKFPVFVVLGHFSLSGALPLPVSLAFSCSFADSFSFYFSLPFSFSFSGFLTHISS